MEANVNKRKKEKTELRSEYTNPGMQASAEKRNPCQGSDYT